MQNMVLIGVFIFLSYFIGAYPAGPLIGRYFAGIDVENSGSKKGGATNVIRTTKDITLGLVVIIIDVGIKGAFWMCIVHFIFTHFPWVALFCFAAVLLGHIFPLFTNFKTGGAGVATTVGGAVVFVPWYCYLLAVAAWLLTSYFSKGIRSLCNMVAIAVLLFSGVFFNFSWEFAVFAVFATFLVVVAHRSNIKRIKRREEDRSPWINQWTDQKIKKLKEIIKKRLL